MQSTELSRNLAVTRSRYDPAAMYTTPFGIGPHRERLPSVGGVTVRHAETRNHYIVNTAINFVLEPFTLEERAEWLRSYHTTGRHQMVVAEAAGVLLGLASTGQFRPKHAYDTTVEVSVVCAPEAVGFRIGQRLYEALFETLRGEDIHMAIAAITLPNRGSCALHERFGFQRVATLREIGRKFDRYWDVAWYLRPFDHSRS
jgi:phosphinothricin acetyltransferase